LIAGNGIIHKSNSYRQRLVAPQRLDDVWWSITHRRSWIMSQSSEQRKQFGVSKAPIVATRAFAKELPHFSEKGIDGKCWILMNDEEGTRVSVNTYNGNAGKGFKAQPHPIPDDEKVLARLIRGYEEVLVGDCPVAVEFSQVVAVAEVGDEVETSEVVDEVETSGINEAEAVE